jgi:hypothetical protein
MTNTMNRCRTGNRRLGRLLNRTLTRAGLRWLNRQCGPLTPNPLRQACVIFSKLVQFEERLQRRNQPRLPRSRDTWQRPSDAEREARLRRDLAIAYPRNRNDSPPAAPAPGTTP